MHSNNQTSPFKDNEEPIIIQKPNPVIIQQLKKNIGPSTWSLLHSIAGNFPEQPTEQDKKQAKNFIDSLAYFYPCEECREDFKEDVAHVPPTLNSRREFSLWVCERHNEVNRKLNKPLMDCTDIWKYWYKSNQHLSSQSLSSTTTSSSVSSSLNKDDCGFCDKFKNVDWAKNQIEQLKRAYNQK